MSTHIPVAVTSLYGQNQPLPVSEDDDDEEAANWCRSHQFDRIKYLSVSIATHLESVSSPYSLPHPNPFPSVREATGWEVREIDDIIEDHGDDIFTHYNQNIRRQLDRGDLSDYPLLKPDGTENPIYTQDGYRIQRRYGTRSRNTLPHGVLMDLRHLDQLFLPDDELFSSSPSFTVYPQGGLVTAGHFQADGLLCAFTPHIAKLNSDIQAQANVHFPMQDLLYPPIVGMGCQGYNAVMHATRGRCAQHHDAQRGLVTAALAGSWANSQSHKQHARSLIQQCNRRLPHAEFRQKISNQNDHPLDCSIRLENTFSIEIERLQPKYMDGANILQDLIIPLGNLWSHPSILDKIKDHCILFKPDVRSLTILLIPF